uniref:Uncharacterized protein n=1 Tax=Salix viminalis TaxID=40686 RepID=A0A6N2LLE6_SALVM
MNMAGVMHYESNPSVDKLCQTFVKISLLKTLSISKPIGGQTCTLQIILSENIRPGAGAKLKVAVHQPPC